MKRIQVAVGVIQKGDKVLVGQRLVKDDYFQKWEFPGGKIEEGEQPILALKRELYEELTIEVHSAHPLIYIEHDYPDRKVNLHVFWVDDFEGDPTGAEGQALQWIKPIDCQKIDFLQANEPIVNAVSLPLRTLITDIDQYGLNHTLNVIETIVEKANDQPIRDGRFAIQVREPNATKLEIDKYHELLRKVSGSNLIFLNGDPDIAKQIGFDGVQLNSHRAKRYDTRNQLPDFWVGVSCHDSNQLMHAEQIADFALLSPICSTRSHPETKGIGWKAFRELVNKAKIPCYALGGMRYEDIRLSCENGGQGIAAISAIWDA